MKPRRVVLTIELQSAAPLRQLVQAVRSILALFQLQVEQVQGNVIRTKK